LQCLLLLHISNSLSTNRCNQESLAKALLQVWVCQKSLVLSDLPSSSSSYRPCSVRLQGIQLKLCLASLRPCLQPQQLHTAEQVFGRDLIFQTGSEGCQQGGLVASEGDEGPTRDPLMLLLGLPGVATEKNCSRAALEGEERERQGCISRGLHGLEQETARQWGLESPCWDSGERDCPQAILCSRLPVLATACAQDTTCLSPSEASIVAKLWLSKAGLLLSLLGIQCPSTVEANTRKAGTSSGQRTSSSFCLFTPMLVLRLWLLNWKQA